MRTKFSSLSFCFFLLPSEKGIIPNYDRIIIIIIIAKYRDLETLRVESFKGGIPITKRLVENLFLHCISTDRARSESITPTSNRFSLIKRR